MKTSTRKTLNRLFTAILCITVLASCGKYKKYDNLEIIENSYTGEIEITSTGTDPAADFIGDGDGGTYSFAWKNTSDVMSLNFDITSPTGSVQFIVNDKKGDEVLNQTITGGTSIDSYSGVSSSGKKGTWKVTMILTNFDGDGSYSLHPGN